MAFEKNTPPYSQKEIRSINEYQQSGVFHPFTCGTDNCGDELVAKEDGLYCNSCDYRQYWVHTWMADFSWNRKSV